MAKTPIRVEALPGEHGLRLDGELDASNVFTVMEPLEGALRGSGEVTLDLSGLRFIDSAGLNALIRLAKSYEGRGRMQIICPPGPVRRVLDLIGLQGTLEHVEITPVEPS
jgi:anti-anti-sigma factor